MLVSDEYKFKNPLFVFFCELSCEKKTLLAGLFLKEAAFQTHLLTSLPGISFWTNASRPFRSQLISHSKQLTEKECQEAS